MSEISGSCSIVIFLPEVIGRQISSKLSEKGYNARVVSAVSDVFDALRHEGVSFAITTRSYIDLLRNIRAVPVINLEIYFHSVGSNTAAKYFDSDAFLERVKFLANAVSCPSNRDDDDVPSDEPARTVYWPPTTSAKPPWYRRALQRFGGDACLY